jgi:hypothetical protein
LPKLYDVDGLNCHDAHVREMVLGDELHYGWAIGPDNHRYQHCWIVRDEQLIDLFNWTDHEDLGVRRRYEEANCLADAPRVSKIFPLADASRASLSQPSSQM